MYKKEYRPNKEYKNTNIPWFNQDRLNPLSIRNKNTTTWVNVKIWNFSFSTTWNKIITWVWFKPKLVMFSVTIWSRSWCWQMTDTWSQNSISFNDWVWLSECIYIRDWWWTLSWRAIYVSMDTDGFTVNVTTASWTTVYVNYTAFW